MRNALCLLAVLGLIGLASVAQADDVTIGEPINPFVFATDLGSVTFEHVEGGPENKGFFHIYVFNNTVDAWKGVKFTLFQSPSTVVFDLNQVPQYNGAAMAASDYSISNLVPPTATLMFESDTVDVGELANFKVFTDNTATGANFGICFEPIPVPEPTTMALLAGGLGVAMLKLRRRRA